MLLERAEDLVLFAAGGALAGDGCRATRRLGGTDHLAAGQLARRVAGEGVLQLRGVGVAVRAAVVAAVDSFLFSS